MFIIRHQYRSCAAAVIAAMIVAFLPWQAFGQSMTIEPQAQNLLKAAATFLASQKRFSVNTHSTIEVVLVSGQKIQFDSAAVLAVQRPDKLQAMRRGDLVNQEFFYDGKSLTLYNPGENYYATVAAPGTLEAMLDFARDTLDIIAPAGDLIYVNAFEMLMRNATSGFMVGKGAVEGTICDHLAFRGPDVDWQIWIQEGERPLPRKLVITSTDIYAAPQFTVVMSQWDLAPKFADGLFDFRPPKHSKRVDFLPMSMGGPQPRKR